MKKNQHTKFYIGLQKVKKDLTRKTFRQAKLLCQVQYITKQKKWIFTELRCRNIPNFLSFFVKNLEENVQQNL